MQLVLLAIGCRQVVAQIVGKIGCQALVEQRVHRGVVRHIIDVTNLQNRIIRQDEAALSPVSIHIIITVDGQDANVVGRQCVEIAEIKGGRAADVIGCAGGVGAK